MRSATAPGKVFVKIRGFCGDRDNGRSSNPCAGASPHTSCDESAHLNFPPGFGSDGAADRQRLRARDVEEFGLVVAEQVASRDREVDLARGRPSQAKIEPRVRVDAEALDGADTPGEGARVQAGGVIVVSAIMAPRFARDGVRTARDAAVQIVCRRAGFHSARTLGRNSNPV